MTDPSPRGARQGAQHDSATDRGAPDTELQPLAVGTGRIIMWGEAAWVVALALTLAVPALHEGDRHWWPWTCVAAIVLGLLGYAYVRRGRGNATGAGSTP